MGKCPACLAFDTQTDAVAVVAGTEYCAQHAVAALAAQPLRGGPGPGGGSANYQVMSLFAPPRAAETPPSTGG